MSFWFFCAGSCLQVAPKSCSKIFNRLFHALLNRSGVQTGGVEARMTHEILDRVGIRHLRRHLSREVVSQLLGGELYARIALVLYFLPRLHGRGGRVLLHVHLECGYTFDLLKKAAPGVNLLAFVCADLPGNR